MLIITIIVIIILSAIVIGAVINAPEMASTASLLGSMDSIQSAVSIHMANNFRKGIVDGSLEDNALKTVSVIGNPDLTTGLLLNLNELNVRKGTQGYSGYSEALTNGSVEFGVSDVYIVDSEGLLYYVKGVKKNDGTSVYTARDIKNIENEE
jgi:hypothetical protein